VSVELKVKEVGEIEERMAALEADGSTNGERWGA
jgi:uncharacterized small protein (DUF1192 family)